MIDSLNPRTMENQIHELEKRPSVEVVANPSGSTGAHVLKKIQIGSTKYAIGGDASNIAYGDSDVDTVLDGLLNSEVTSTALEGFSFAASIAKAGALVGGSIQVTGSASANAWTDIGSIGVLPDHIIMLPLVNVSSGAYVGMARIKTNGEISIFPTTSISSSTVAFDFSYHEYIAP